MRTQNCKKAYLLTSQLCNESHHPSYFTWADGYFDTKHGNISSNKQHRNLCSVNHLASSKYYRYIHSNAGFCNSSGWVIIQYPRPDYTNLHKYDFISTYILTVYILHQVYSHGMINTVINTGFQTFIQTVLKSLIHYNL